MLKFMSTSKIFPVLPAKIYFIPQPILNLQLVFRNFLPFPVSLWIVKQTYLSVKCENIPPKFVFLSLLVKIEFGEEMSRIFAHAQTKCPAVITLFNHATCFHFCPLTFFFHCTIFIACTTSNPEPNPISINPNLDPHHNTNPNISPKLNP